MASSITLYYNGLLMVSGVTFYQNDPHVAFSVIFHYSSLLLAVGTTLYQGNLLILHPRFPCLALSLSLPNPLPVFGEAISSTV